MSPGQANYSISGTQCNGLINARQLLTALIFTMRPITPWCAWSIPTADTSCTARRTTIAAWGWPRAARLYPGSSTCPPTSNWDPASCTWWGTAFHRRGKGSASARTREHGQSASQMQTTGEILYSEDDRRIIPANVGPSAVIALWSSASPILPPQHAPRNESHRQYSPSISSRSRSLPNGCAREARESPCLRWS